MNQLVASLSNNYVSFTCLEAERRENSRRTEAKGFIMEESDRVEAYPAGHPPFILLYTIIIIYLTTLRI